MSSKLSSSTSWIAGPEVLWRATVCLVLLAGGRVAVAEPAPPNSFGITTWAEQSAVPFQSVNSVLQARSGYLWMATDSGVVRFDGMRFKVFSRSTFGLLSNAVTAIAEDGDGHIVAGFEAGGICVLRSDAAACDSVQQGFPKGSVRAIQVDSRGVVWVALRGGGLVREEGTKRRVYGSADGLPTLNLAGVYVDRSDVVWMCTYDGGLVRLKDGAIETIREPVLPSNLVWSVVEDAEGNLWVATFKGLCRFSAGTVSSPQVFSKADGLPNDNVTHAYIDHAGRLWATASHGGVSLRMGSRFTNYSVADGLADMTVLALSEDAEGDLWVGTKGGLSRLRPQSFQAFTSRSGLYREGVRIVFEDRKGDAWLGLSDGGLQELHMAAELALSPAHVEDGCAPLAGLVAHDGTMWVGCSGGVVLRRGTDGTERRFPLGGPGHVVEVNAFVEMADHRLFAATFGDGLAEYRDGVWTPHAALPEVNNIDAALTSPDGLWVATFDRGLYRIARDGTTRAYADQLGTAIPTSLNRDSDGSVWVETDHGLVHAAGDRAVMVRFAGTVLADATVYNLLDDGRGQYWISSSAGIARVPRAMLLSGALSEGAIRLFGASDGVRGVNYQGYAQPTAMAGSDGRLYFGSSKGISIVDPKNTVAEPGEVVVRMDEILVDDKRQPEGASAIVAPAASSEVEFEFSAKLLGEADKARYQYRLSGVDGRWVDAGDQHSATYRNLPPGVYRFEVRASLNGAAWQSPPVTVTLTKQAHTYQRLWFRLVAFAVFAGLIRLVYLRQIANARHAEARLQSAVLEERHAAAQQQARELTQMNESLRSNLSRLADGSDLPTIMQQVLASAVQQLRGSGARIFIANDATELLEQQYAYGGPPDDLMAGENWTPGQPVTVPLHLAPVWLQLLRTREALLLDLRKPEDAAMLWELAVRWHRKHELPFVLWVPLVLSSRVLGLLSVNFRADVGAGLTPEQLELANSLASLAAMALETHRLSLSAREAAIADERTRLSEEMHDGIQQIFTAISIQVAAAASRARRAQNVSELTPDLERIAETAEHGIREIRRSIRALHAAATLNGRELLQRLAELCSSVTATLVDCELSAPAELDLPSSSRLNDLYRIAQEAVTNANKHAQATRVRITVEAREAGLYLSVSDNGRGLQPGGNAAGFGMRNMEERAKRLGGKLLVESVPGRTEVSVEAAYVGLR